jgi:hypothetical protein
VTAAYLSSFRKGGYWGEWNVTPLMKSHEPDLEPSASHPVLVARVLAAFSSPEEHYLLSPPDRNPQVKDTPFILVKKAEMSSLDVEAERKKVREVGRKKTVLKCSFIATVFGQVSSPTFDYGVVVLG